MIESATKIRNKKKILELYAPDITHRYYLIGIMNLTMLDKSAEQLIGKAEKTLGL